MKTNQQKQWKTLNSQQNNQTQQFPKDSKNQFRTDCDQIGGHKNQFPPKDIETESANFEGICYSPRKTCD